MNDLYADRHVYEEVTKVTAHAQLAESMMGLIAKTNFVFRLSGHRNLQEPTLGQARSHFLWQASWYQVVRSHPEDEETE